MSNILYREYTIQIYSECVFLYDQNNTHARAHNFKWSENTKTPTTTTTVNNIKYIQIKLENKPL